MIVTLAQWLSSRSRQTRLAVYSFGIGLFAYATALVGAQIAELLAAGTLWKVLIHAVLACLFLSVFTLVTELVRSEVENLVERREKLLADSLRALNKWVAGDMEDLSRTPGDMADDQFALSHYMNSMRGLAHALLDAVEANFTKGPLPGEDVRFEVTFMTYSYIDSEITIAAWANSEGHAPPSLRMRKTNPNIYSRTVTARLYELDRATPVIIPDTSDSSAEYSELYEGELTRIRSTIVYPVLGPDSSLLGTLVLHCDKTNLFDPKEEQLWRSVLGPYATRFALLRSHLDGRVQRREFRPQF